MVFINYIMALNFTKTLLSVRVIFSTLNVRVLFMVLSDRVIIDRSGRQSCLLFPICTYFNLLKVDALFYIFRTTFRLIN